MARARSISSNWVNSPVFDRFHAQIDRSPRHVALAFAGDAGVFADAS